MGFLLTFIDHLINFRAQHQVGLFLFFDLVQAVQHGRMIAVAQNAPLLEIFSKFFLDTVDVCHLQRPFRLGHALAVNAVS